MTPGRTGACRGAERDPRGAALYTKFPNVALPVFPSATSDTGGSVVDYLIPPPVHRRAPRLIDTERVEAKLTIQLDVRRAEAAGSAVVRLEIGALADIVTRTLPEGGMDRMTSEQVEELLAVPALTAHL